MRRMGWWLVTDNLLKGKKTRKKAGYFYFLLFKKTMFAEVVRKPDSSLREVHIPS